MPKGSIPKLGIDKMALQEKLADNIAGIKGSREGSMTARHPASEVCFCIRSNLEIIVEECTHQVLPPSRAVSLCIATNLVCCDVPMHRGQPLAVHSLSPLGLPA